MLPLLLHMVMHMPWWLPMTVRGRLVWRTRVLH
jgi:hypothetical protein